MKQSNAPEPTPCPRFSQALPYWSTPRQMQPTQRGQGSPEARMPLLRRLRGERRARKRLHEQAG